MNAAVYTLGCKVNQYESQEIITNLQNNGYTITDHRSIADIYIINSCTVTAQSTQKTRQAVRRFRNKNPEAIIVLTGCFPQAFPDEAAQLSEADIILGNKTNDTIPSAINRFVSEKKQVIDIRAHSREDKYKGVAITDFEGHTRAFIKIQDGCNRYCSYCTIPKAKGFSRSRPVEDIKKEIENLAQLGYKEIVFVGINLSAYGLDTSGDICDALILAEETDGIERFRLGSLEPDHITDDIIKKLSEMKKFCPQFHLSLQSGSNNILKRMNRHYTAEEYFTLCEKLKNTFKDCSLTTDIIVGFPGETDDDFNKTLSFAEKCRFMKVHVFPFSARKGTPAFNYPDKVANEIKNHRCAVLQRKCDEIRSELMNSYNGRIFDVLFETPKNGCQQGYTKNYTPVSVKESTCLIGNICSVKITDANDDYCFGEIIR